MVFGWLLLVFIGFYSISPFHDVANFGLLLLGFYLVLLGLTKIRDGLFFEANLSKNHLKRRVRVSLPIFLTALIPATTLNKVNAFLQENIELSAAQAYNQVKGDQSAQLEIFIHTAETNLFSKIGHVDLCYQGQVIS